MSIIVNLENHNDKFSVRMGLDIFCVRYVFFFYKYGHVRLQTLYLQVNSFPEILDLSDCFRQYLGQYVDICLLFFPPSARWTNQ